MRSLHTVLSGNWLWDLAYRSAEFTIFHVYAKLVSGKIDEVEELEYFMNELERNPRDLDPQATTSLATMDSPRSFTRTVS
jgi:hypothetical protein